MKKYFLSFIIFILSLNLLCAQNPLIKQYTIKDGLPTNTIYHTYQDKDKFLWFATDNGVIQFNGVEFRTYNIDDGLSDNEIIRIKQDYRGRIWFFDLKGKANYYYKNKIYNDQNSEVLRNLNSDFFIRNFFEGEDSTLYLYNTNSDVYIINKKDSIFKVNLKNKYSSKLLYFNKSYEGGFLLWSNSALVKLKDFQSEPIWVNRLHGTRGIFPNDKNNCILYNNTDGLVFYNDTKIAHKINIHLGTNIINSILKAKDGVIWISTLDKGVFCIKNDKIINHLDVTEAQAIIQDSDDNIWITSMNNGIYKINPSFHQIKHFNNSSFGNKSIRDICKSNDGKLWASNGNFIFLADSNSIHSINSESQTTSIEFIQQLKNSTLITGGANRNIFRTTNFKSSLNSNIIRADKKIIYEGAFGKKLKINKAENKIAAIAVEKIAMYDLSENVKDIDNFRINSRIYFHYFNTNDELIINASKNYSLHKNQFIESNILKIFNGRIMMSHLLLNDSTEVLSIQGNDLYLIVNQKKIINLTRQLGFKSTYSITKLAYDGSRLFFSTPKNIYLIKNPLDFIANKLTQISCLNIEFNNIIGLVCSGGMLYIASNNGITIIPKSEYLKNNELVFTPYFYKVLVHDQEVNTSLNKIDFRGNNKLSIHFSSINYSSNKTKYAYLMEGIDDEWLEGKERMVVYQNLPPGSYIFRLKSRINSSPYSKPIDLVIEVKPSFLQNSLTWVGIVAIIIMLFSVLYFYIKNRKLKRRETEHQLVSLENKALQLMMNPHFIFNSLGSIQNYLLQNKSSEAGLYLSQFARLIRQNMNSLKSNFISIEDEVDRLRNYLDLEKFRMNNKFDYAIIIDRNMDSDEVLIPSMIIQPFVENAIWHGISPLNQDGQINIQFKQVSQKRIHVLIEDNGIGMARAKSFRKSNSHLNMGMEITRKRLIAMSKKFDVKSSFKIDEAYPNQPNPGTRITLSIPSNLEATEQE